MRMTTQLRVLIVEDSEDDCLLLLDRLRRGGYDPLYQRVETEKEMEEALDRRKWDIILCDHALPSFSAFGALALMKKKGLDFPFIIVSGTVGEETAVKAMKAGAHDYLMKDNMARLLPAIERELREAKERNKRRRTEEALRASEKRYRELFDSISDIIYTQDMEGRFTTVNLALARTFGVPRHKLVGHKPDEFMKQAFRDEFRNVYLKGLKEQGHFEGTSLYFDVEGKRHYIEYRSILVQGEGGSMLISGSGREVTERVNAEKRLKQLQDQLLQAQKMEAVGTLAGGIAHDFNNILQAILGSVQLLWTHYGLDETTQKYLSQIHSSAERAGELVKRLLTFSRKVETNVHSLDLNDMVTQSVKILERTLPRMIELDVSLAATLPRIKGDDNQLEQVLLNLGANSRDAMEDGGKITIRTEAVEVQDELCRRNVIGFTGPAVKLSFSDTGYGMDDETMKHIFEPFYTTKEVGKGTGLGLAMVYGIVKSHDGAILCSSTPGSGTTFEIFFPVPAHEMVQPAGTGTPKRVTKGGTETILLVDDDEAIVDIGRSILERFGYVVVTASSGEDAIKLYREIGRNIALVILDLSMPGMGGSKCLNILLQADPTVKVLIASGYSADMQIGDMAAMGAAGFIGKPFRLDELLRKVREILDA